MSQQFCAASAASHQFHYVVQPENQKRNGFFISLATFGSRSKDYSFVRGCIVGIPEELVPCPGCEPDRFWMHYRIFDSDGYSSLGKVYWQRHQSPNLPEFTFVAHRKVHYTVVVSVELPSGIEATRTIMLAPVAGDCDCQNYERNSLSERFNRMREQLRKHNAQFRQKKDTEEEDYEPYPGDSLPKPTVTREQLDRELDDFTILAQLCRSRSMRCDCSSREQREIQHEERDIDLVTSRTKCSVATATASLERNDGDVVKDLEFRPNTIIDDDEQINGSTAVVADTFDEKEWQGWWANRWDLLHDEEYETEQRYQQQVANYYAPKSSSNTTSSESSSSEDDEIRQITIELGERDEEENYADECIQECVNVMDGIDKEEKPCTTAAARAACHQELARQW